MVPDASLQRGAPGGDAPASPEPLALIHEAWAARDAQAVAHRRYRARFAVFAALIGPLAVLVLMVQMLFFGFGGPVAILLIAIEVLALVVALAVGTLRINRSHREWIRHRLLAQVLKREEFLLRTRVGPYLRTDEGHAASQVRQRLIEIEGQADHPLPLLELRDRQTGDWRERLEDAHGDHSWVPLSDPAGLLRAYREERVATQRRWFADREASAREKDRLHETLAKLALTAAVIVSALHLGMLLAHESQGAPAPHRLLLLLAVVLPPIGATFVGLRSIFEYHRLSRSYALQAESLSVLEGQLVALERESESGNRSPEEVAFQLRRIAVRTEELLAHDLRQWFLFVYPEPPRSGA